MNARDCLTITPIVFFALVVLVGLLQYKRARAGMPT